MSFNKFLNNKKTDLCDYVMTHSILSMDNRNQDDYFFNKSDLEKMEYFSRLTSRYRLCKKIYYYFNSSSNLWIEEKTDDSIIHRICQETAEILLPEKKQFLKY